MLLNLRISKTGSSAGSVFYRSIRERRRCPELDSGRITTLVNCLFDDGAEGFRPTAWKRFGNEGEPDTDEALSRRRRFHPHPCRAESLNITAAAAICL